MARPDVADVLGAFQPSRSGVGMLDDVVDHYPDLVAHQLAQLAVARRMGMPRLDRAPQLGDEIEREQLVEIDEPRAQSVIDVVVVIGDIVGDVGHLRLERGPSPERQRKGAVDFGQRPVRRRHRPVVLCHPLEHFPAQIEPLVFAIGAFEPRHDADGVGVVVETARLRHRLGQCPLPRVAEGRVADVMRQRERLGQILVQPEQPRDHSSDLRHLQAVRQPGAVEIPVGGDEHLRLGAQAAERGRVDDPVAVALERAAGAARLAARRGELAPAAVRGIGCVGGDTHAGAG